MRIGELIGKFKGVRALVVGDLMLDEYLFGEPLRISPEAPVMVLKHRSRKTLPGGAANVALNLGALGADVRLVGMIGDDSSGSELLKSLEAAGFDTAPLVRDSNRPTTRKTRIVADTRHQVLRIDTEDDQPADGTVAASLSAHALEEIGRAQVVLLSDYRKGVLTKQLVEEIIDAAKTRGIPVLANAKPESISWLLGASLITVNRSEAAQFLGMQSFQNEDALDVAKEMRTRSGVGGVLVTLGSAGMAYCGSGNYRVPAHEVEVADPAGAGDTVAACIALGLATVGDRREIFELAAAVAARTVQHVGVATPTEDDLSSLRLL